MNIEIVSPIEPNLIAAQSISETEQQTPLLFSHGRDKFTRFQEAP